MPSGHLRESQSGEAEGSQHRHAAGSGKARRWWHGSPQPGSHTLHFLPVAKVCPFCLTFENSLYSTVFS